MNILSIIMLIFALLGALDRIFGNKFGLGAEFERGFMLLGNMALAMIGIICLAPSIALFVSPASDAIYEAIGIDPSIFAASILANDSGGTPLALALAKDIEMGNYNAYIISAMMGTIISYTMPYALSVVKKEHYNDMFLGFLCGIVTIPVGAVISGLVLGLPVLALLWNLTPLLILSVIISVGLIFAQRITVKVFYFVGIFMKVLITVGLACAMFEAVTGIKTIPGLAPISEGGLICLNAAIVLAGAFPLMYIVSKLLKRPLGYVSKKVGINEVSSLGLITSVVSSAPVFDMVNRMDRRGIILNSAFAVSAAFTVGGHLAYTMTLDPNYVLPMMLAKLISGIAALVPAFLISKNTVENKNLS